MTNSVYIIFTAVLVCTCALSALFTRLIIPKLKSLKLGQTILDIGPRWHKSKEGTPTMGGAVFLLVLPLFSLATALFLGEKELFPLICVISFALLCGAVDRKSVV